MLRPRGVSVNLLRLMLLLLCVAFMHAPHAREFRALTPIVRPEAPPPGAQAVAVIRPVPRLWVEQAVHAVARAWNTGELDPLFAADFTAKSRLLDTIAEVVPRDARLNILGIQAVSTLNQYRLGEALVSTVSAVVRGQVEFIDPRTGYQRLEGTAEWYFRVEEGATGTVAGVTATGRLPDAAALEHMRRVAELNERLRRLPPPVFERAPTRPGVTPLAEAALIGAEARLPHTGPAAGVIHEIRPASPQWDQEITILGTGFGDTQVLRLVYAVLPDRDRTVIDFGCSSGRTAASPSGWTRRACRPCASYCPTAAPIRRARRCG